MKIKIRVLHIAQDDKFFDSVFATWEHNELFLNSAIFVTDKPEYQFQRIKSHDSVELLWNHKMVKDRLERNDYDIVFFYSMPSSNFSLFKYIPKDKILIWWGWGFDLYDEYPGISPLIKLDLFKPLTDAYKPPTSNNIIHYLSRLRFALKKPLIERKRSQIISRIDYFQPVVRSEYNLMCKNVKCFRAKEFYYKLYGCYEYVTQTKLAKGNILLGNSATPTNNHLDVLQYVLKYKHPEQKIIIPLNYGNSDYRDWLKARIHDDSIVPIYDFLPKDEYFEIVNSCTYAIFGTIRQQAMGTINQALRRGVKVFLYKDSVAYQNHKELGYAIYAIEDMDSHSLINPLSVKELEQNRIASEKENMRRLAVYESCCKDFISKIQ